MGYLSRALLLALLLASRLVCAQDASGIALTALTPVQTDNLATLGKVWGFLKYHHPAVTAGKRQWDSELLQVMPAILAAPDRSAGNRVLQQWIAAQGPVPACTVCAHLPTGELHLRPALDWLGDRQRLGAPLSGALQAIYGNRRASGGQFYLTQDEQVGNPVFRNEPAYEKMAYPDAGLQLLALFRFWNIIEYWSPYRNLIDENWDAVLRQSIASVALAATRDSYQLAMLGVAARVHDTHTNLWGSLGVRPPLGECSVPVVVRFVGSRAVVAEYAEAQAGKASGLLPGDVIDAIDAQPVASLVASWSPYYAASNQPTRLRDIAARMGRGACGDAQLSLRRGQQDITLTVPRSPGKLQTRRNTHDRDGDAFQLLPGHIAYLKLSSIKAQDIPGYLQAAKGSVGMIIDIRGYPSEFVVFALGQHLVASLTEFARFTQGDLANPGAFVWQRAVAIEPAQPRYAGRVVILTDEMSMSQAEYTAMALRAAPGAKVIGSTTAGADGNISTFPLPGRFSSLISGIGVFYPDKRPTQRVGIVPDIEVNPTVEGIRDGRDEVLEAAIAELGGAK